MDKSITALVVSYNTRELTLRCINSILLAGDLLAEVVVVDNGSTDGSLGAVVSLSPKVRGIAAGANLGFGAANNLGVLSCRTKYVAFVNSDAVLEADSLSILTAFLELHPTVALVGPMLLNEDGSRQESYFPFPTPIGAWFDNLGMSGILRASNSHEIYQPKAVPWISGACMVCPRGVLETVGIFDDEFFLYSEETDWQRRIRDSGGTIFWIPESQVIHLGGGSGGCSSAFVRECFYDGVDRYFQKHHGWVGLISMRCATVVGAFLRMFSKILGGYLNRDFMEFWWVIKRQVSQGFPLPGAAAQRRLISV